LVRQARPEDRAAVQRLYEQLCPGEPVRVLASRIEQILEDPNQYLLVHETDGQIDGTVFVSFCPDPMFGTLPFGVVENLCVLEENRGGGIGRRLMVAVEELAREMRSTKLMLLSMRSREKAHRLFRSLGYSGDAALGFKKYLGTEKEPGA
jgi:N-acetylglutamate synthase-like GNAT family acetyltransferase